jgi:hypothetical protein
MPPLALTLGTMSCTERTTMYQVLQSMFNMMLRSTQALVRPGTSSTGSWPASTEPGCDRGFLP